MNVSSHFVVRSTCIASCCAAAVFSMHLRSPIADAACWDIDMRDCCDGQRLGDPCNGETCPYVITENGEWDKKKIADTGWDLLAFSFQTDQECRARRGRCDYTQSTPTCILDAEPSLINTCTDYDIPAGPKTCPS